MATTLRAVCYVCVRAPSLSLTYGVHRSYIGNHLRHHVAAPAPSRAVAKANAAAAASTTPAGTTGGRGGGGRADRSLVESVSHADEHVEVEETAGRWRSGAACLCVFVRCVALPCVRVRVVYKNRRGLHT